MNTALATKMNSNTSSSISGYIHYRNHSEAYNQYGTQFFGSITVNRLANAEMNFIQNSAVPGLNYRAFNFMIATSNTTFDEIVRINKNGDIITIGALSSPTITTINNNVGLKADKTYVDNQLLLKDDVSSVNTKISNLQTQINNIELIEGPQGPQGPQGIQGIQGIQGPVGEFTPGSDISCNNINVSGSITNTELTNLIATKAPVHNPSFTGTTNIVNFNNTGTFNSPALQTLLNTYVLTSAMNTALATKMNSNTSSSISGYIHYRNHSEAYNQYGTQFFGSITVNRLANAEMNFIQNSAVPGLNYRAFNFMIATSNTTFDEIVRINKNGDIITIGALSSPTITTINNNITTINNSISNINNTSDINKPVSTAQQTALNLKANVNNTVLTGTSIIPTSSQGTINCNNQIYFHNGNINTPSAPSSRIHIASNEMMVWDNLQTKFIFWRWGVSNVYQQAFYDNGDVSIRGQILDSPTITELENSIDTKADLTYTNTQLALKANTNSPSFTGTTTTENVNINGDASITGNITSPTITTLNNNIALKCNSNNATLTGTTSIENLNHTGTINSPALQTIFNNYALLNSSPTFTGTVKGKIYSGDLTRSSSSIVFTPSTLPSTILQDTGLSNTSIGIPNMPIGTRFTVMKTSSSLTIYSTDINVYFYSRRTTPIWTNSIVMREDSRTFIRVEVFNTSTLSMNQVWMTESSHTYNLLETINTSMVGAYMLDGPNYGTTATATYRPITCSNKIFGPGNSDDGYIVNEGFALIVYTGENYTGTAYTLSNYNIKETPGPLHFQSPTLNDMQSCKLFYNTVEVIIAGISN